MVGQSLDARSLVFVDEMGTHISLSPLYAWAKKGQRAYCSVAAQQRIQHDRPFEHDP
jgi:hypothetical protein